MKFTRKCVAPGIYQDSRTGNFYERPTIDRKPTWRKLNGHTIKLAREELSARRTDQARAIHGLARDPYAPASVSVSELCKAYEKAGYPDRQQHPKNGKARSQEQSRIKKLLTFWAQHEAATIKPKDCSRYFTARKKTVRKGMEGGRAVDMELGTLNAIFQWAAVTGRIDFNPLAIGRPKFRVSKQVRHCREFMPTDGNELHALAAKLFSVRRSEALGWQLLVEAMTGCRTSEVLRLRWDAENHREPGFIERKWLWIERSKGGVKPFVTIHPALAKCIKALNRWRAWRFPRSQWWFPRSRSRLPVASTSLTRSLSNLVKNKKHPSHRTSHGLRAYYVTVRRSQGISDAQIADEIGDKSGAAIIVSTYGAVPPNWRGSKGLSWMPLTGKPAWESLKWPENIIPMEPVSRDVFHVEQKA